MKAELDKEKQERAALAEEHKVAKADLEDILKKFAAAMAKLKK